MGQVLARRVSQGHLMDGSFAEAPVFWWHACCFSFAQSDHFKEDFMERTLKAGKSDSVQSALQRFECNLCGKTCRSVSKYKRFCRGCRSQNDVLRFSEWFGTAPTTTQRCV